MKAIFLPYELFSKITYYGLSGDSPLLRCKYNMALFGVVLRKGLYLKHMFSKDIINAIWNNCDLTPVGILS